MHYAGAEHQRTLYPARASTPELSSSRGPTPPRDQRSAAPLPRAPAGPSAAVAAAAPQQYSPAGGDDRPQLTTPFVVRAIQEGLDCPQLEVASRPVRYLLLREGCFALRLESALHEPLIAKLEVDGKMTKSNFRILPCSSHTIRETRGGTGMHAVPLAFSPSPDQRRPAGTVEDVDLQTGLLRIFFYAVANTSDGKWEIASRQQPMEVVMLKYGFRDTLARFFNVPLEKGAGKDGGMGARKGSGGGTVPPVPRDLVVYNGGGGGGRTATPPPVQRAATPKLRQLSPRALRAATPAAAPPPSAVGNPMSGLLVSHGHHIETADRCQEGAPPGIQRAVHPEPFVSKFDGSHPSLSSSAGPAAAATSRHGMPRLTDGSQHSMCVNCERLFAVERSRLLAEVERWKKKAADGQRLTSALNQKVALLSTQSRMLQDDLHHASEALQRTAVPSRSLREITAGPASGRPQQQRQHRSIDDTLEMLDDIVRYSTERHGDGDGEALPSASGGTTTSAPGPQTHAGLPRGAGNRWESSDHHTEYQIAGRTVVSPAKQQQQYQQQQFRYLQLQHQQPMANAVLLPPQYPSRASSSTSAAAPPSGSVSQTSSRAGSGPRAGGGDAPAEDDDILRMAMQIIAQERQLQRSAPPSTAAPSAATGTAAQTVDVHAEPAAAVLQQQQATPAHVSSRPATVSTGSQVKPTERPLLSVTRKLIGEEDGWEPPAKSLPTSQAKQPRQEDGDELDRAASATSSSSNAARQQQQTSGSPQVPGGVGVVAYIDPFARRGPR